MKKLMIGLASAMPFASVFADGETPSQTTTAVNTMLENTQSALQGLITHALPIVTAIVIAGLTIWGGFKLLALLKKAFGFGTNR